DPAGRCRDLDGHLVGDDLEQGLVLGYRIPNLLKPGTDDHLGPFGLIRRRGDRDQLRHHQFLIQNSSSSRILAEIPSTLGNTAFMSPTLYGVGTSGIARREMGASRLRNASSAMTAAISAPKPAVRVSSCTMRQRRVLRTEPSTASRSHGATVRRSITS